MCVNSNMDARLVVPNESAPTHLWDNKRGLRGRSHSASSDVSHFYYLLTLFFFKIPQW